MIMLRSRCALFAHAVIVVMALALSVSSHAATTPPGMPPAGKVLLGVGGTALGPVEFDSLTRLTSRHKIHLVTATWDEQRYGGWEYALMRRFQDSEDGRYRLMIHLGPTGPNGKEARSPGAVARGVSDAYLLDLSRYINERDEYVYIRPPAEMNGHWSVWSAFDKSGRRRNADHSTRSYRRAFIRIAAIVRGGSVQTINRRLNRNGMPALRTSATSLPASGKVALVWNPQAEGSPNVTGNQPKDYYPGAAWVDYVANDLYVQRGRAAWTQQEAFYARYQKAHPFMIGEYAPWGYDDPAFVQRMFAWTKSHPRTVAQLYFNGTGGTSFYLADKPKSLAAYRTAIRAARFRCVRLSATRATC